MKDTLLHDGLRYAVPAVIAVLAVAMRIRRTLRPRRLHLRTMWIVPGLYLIACAVMLVEYTPGPSAAMVYLSAFVAGTLLGWRRGRTIRIAVAPDTGELRQQGSAAEIVFLLTILGARAFVRGEAGLLHVDVATVTGAAAVFMLGLLGATRLEMFWRAKRLLAAEHGRP